MDQATKSSNGVTRSFAEFLRAELARRCSKNADYSLRAFGKHLGVHPSHLSNILNGKRVPTPPVVSRISLALGLKPSEMPWLIGSGEVLRTLENRELTEDEFSLIADWYHYATLELLLTSDFESKPEFVAKRLKISIHEARAAVERLVRLGMIKIGRDGSWAPSQAGNTTLGSKNTTPAFRRLQKQILSQAIETLEQVSIDKRDQSSVTLAIDEELVPEYKRLISKFRSEFVALRKKSKKRNAVYQMSFSFFPVTRSSEE